jgi:ribonuclease-3
MVHPLLILHNEALLLQALTHRSYLQEYPNAQDNERLEFLGDAILNFLTGDYLYRNFPDVGEDELTRRRSALVDEVQLARFALEIGLDAKLRMGKGLARDGGAKNPNLLSCAFEAVVGAFYLDHGNLDELRPLIEALFNAVPPSTLQRRSNLDSKNQLQEWAQLNFKGALPRYQTYQIGGVDHAPEYLAHVLIGEKVFGEGKGKGKKAAEKLAAEDALAKIKNEVEFRER